MKNISFQSASDEIISTGVNEFSGVGRVKINSAVGDMIVVCCLVDTGLWRAMLTTDRDGELPDWRTTYSIDDDGVMPKLIVHAPDDALAIIEKDSENL